MRLTRHLTALLLTAVFSGVFLFTAVPAKADCEYEGTLKAGTVDCSTWGDDEQAGNGENGTSGVSNSQDGTSNSDAPVCRDGNDEVVPCSYRDDNGDVCVFANAVAAPPGGVGGAIYVCQPPSDEDETEGEPATTVDPVALAWRATTSIGLRAVDMQIEPTPVADDSESMGLVGLPVWLWAEDTAGTWGPRTATASDGPVSVTVTARADRIEWDMGDGTTVTCTGRPANDGEGRKPQPGTRFDPERHSAQDESPDCGHIYRRTSDDQPDGLYTVTATSYWVAEWVDNTGRTGTIPFDFTATARIRIGELQVIRTGSS